jgi:hypothetical protein
MPEIIEFDIPAADRPGLVKSALEAAAQSGVGTIEEALTEVTLQYQQILCGRVPPSVKRAIVGQLIASGLSDEVQNTVISDNTVAVTFIDLVKGGIVEITPTWV